MDTTDLKSFFDGIESYTSFERKKALSDFTNNYDLNLLTEFSNSFVEYCFLKFNEINFSLPCIQMPEKAVGDIWLNEFHFPFYEFIQNEVQKEVRTELFSNISFDDSIKFNSFMNTFLEEIETIIQNQNIRISNKPQRKSETKNLISKVNKKSSTIKEFIEDVLQNKYSKFDAIRTINSTYNIDTFEIFFKEFQMEYIHKSCDFLMRLSNEDIFDAIEEKKDNLDYIFIENDKIESLKNANFIRCIKNQYDIILNCFFMPKEYFEKSTKFIFINDLMIDYDPAYAFTGIGEFYENVLEDFGNIKLLKEIYLYLKSKKNTENQEPEAIDLGGTSSTKKAGNYKDKIWFRTGIKLATGEAYDLYSKYKSDNGHFTKICLELGFKETDRPYFSATINDNISDKNTFAYKDKLQKLHQYLTENNLPLGAKFLEKFNQIELP